MRPKALAEVAALAARGDSFDRCLANFLDEFYAAPNAQALAGRTPISPPPRKSWPGASNSPCPRGPWENNGNFTGRGSPRRWPRSVLCCCWKARPPSAPATFSSAKTPCPAPERKSGSKPGLDATKFYLFIGPM